MPVFGASNFADRCSAYGSRALWRRSSSAMKWGREIARTCLAGIVVHVVIVGACTAGGDRGGGQPVVLLDSDAGGVVGTGGSGVGASGGTTSTSTTVRPPGIDSGSPTMVPVASANAAESGTRLRAIWQVAEDGAKQFLFQWRDTHRNEDCTFALAGDDVLRCMPATTINFAGYFSDAECTQRLFYRIANSACVAQGQVLGTLTETAGCEYRSRRFTVTAITRPSTMHVLSNGACTETTTNTGFDYFAGGAEIPPSSFVAATNQVE